MVDQYSLMSNQQQPSSNRCDHHSINTYFIDGLAQSTAASTDRSYNSSIEPQTNPKLQSAMSPVEATIEPMHDQQHMQSMLASSDQQSNRSYRWGYNPNSTRIVAIDTWSASSDLYSSMQSSIAISIQHTSVVDDQSQVVTCTNLIDWVWWSISACRCQTSTNHDRIDAIITQSASSSSINLLNR